MISILHVELAEFIIAKTLTGIGFLSIVKNQLKGTRSCSVSKLSAPFIQGGGGAEGGPQLLLNL